MKPYAEFRMRAVLPARGCGFLAMALAAGLTACGGQPSRPSAPPAVSVPTAEATAATASAGMELSYRRGLMAMQRKDWNGAEREFKALAAAHPDIPGPQVNLGIVYREAAKPEEAETTLKAAAQRWPAFAPANHQLGLLLRSQGKFLEADAAYERALAADPNYAAAHYNRAVLNDIYLQRPEIALAHYEQYQKLQSQEDVQVSRWIADLRRRTGIAAPAAASPSPAADTGTEAPAAVPAPAGAAPVQTGDKP